MILRALLTAAAVAAAAGSVAEEPVCRLPKPHYRLEPTDPPWLRQAVQFHGHLGPWAAAGLRLGMAGLRVVEAEGYFDVEVVAEGPFVKPPVSCFLDGLQVSTGATWGKRNLDSVKGERIVVRFKNTRSGKTAEVRPTAGLMKLLTSFQPSPKTGKPLPEDDQGRHPADDPLEQVARQIASMPEKELLTVTVSEP